VGLVTGACLADFGNTVTCVDSDAGKIDRLRAVELPFFEPGLPEMVQRNVNEGRLHFTTDLPAAVKDSKVVFITVGTPPRADGSADTSAIYAVAKTVASGIRTGDVLARIGGEEFLVLLPDTGQEGAQDVAERIRHGVENLSVQLPQGEQLRCTISIGIAVLGHDNSRWEDLVSFADRALYRAKELGRAGRCAHH